MRAWEVQTDWGIDNLALIEKEHPGAPKTGEILVRMRAAAINHRDLVTVLNRTPFGKLPQIPFSDGAGEVIATGPGITRFGIGDHVCPSFFPDWIDGPPTSKNRGKTPGSASAAGVLQDFLIIHENAASKVTDHLTWVEAATLPCAGLTAWRSLVAEGGVKAGDIVLVQGTGGVSIFALQFAKLHGATVIVTSSSDEKLARAQRLGADMVINYRDTPEWGAEVLRLTGGRGVDHIIEVGGAGTINQSLVAAATGADIYIIGVLNGRSQELLIPTIFNKNLRIRGITVGSRTQFDAMNAEIALQGMRPVVDKVYAFADVQAGLRHICANTHFGKICVAFDG